eukprot:5766741-Prymnesium_polylepis.1
MGRATEYAMHILEREATLRLQPALQTFTTISRHTIGAVEACVPLQRLLVRDGVPQPLPLLGSVCERLVEG